MTNIYYEPEEDMSDTINKFTVGKFTLNGKSFIIIIRTKCYITFVDCKDMVRKKKVFVPETSWIQEWWKKIGYENEIIQLEDKEYDITTKSLWKYVIRASDLVDVAAEE